MLGGFDEIDGTSLYHMDYLGAIIKCDFAAFGYGGMLTLSIMDRYHSTSEYSKTTIFSEKKNCMLYLVDKFNFFAFLQVVLKKKLMN